jgi:DNA-binding NtrC family response regulator
VARHDIDLLVTDVVMPGGSGAEVARMVWDAKPGLGVIFLSGHSGTALDDELLARRNVRFLAKPLNPDELLALMNELTGA